MKNQIILALPLLMACAVLIPAQNNPEQALKNVRDRFSDIKNRSIELERTKRDAGKAHRGGDPAQRFPEIKEDFERIQILNTEILQPFVKKTPLDFSAVYESASEINRRAERLKSNLFSGKAKPPKDSGNKEQIKADRQTLENLLIALDNSINDFVHSSIFQNINLVNSKDSLKAQSDLETTIKLSFLIKETAEQITKSVSQK
ncbi:MAG: hypothetical protein JWN60_739 [Acidobacteria bacterium]|jgi:hypothetical protein|nr:hypothetical protein [Acidobacteriota bacterium]